MILPSLDKIDDDIRGKSLAAMEEEVELLDGLILHINRGTALLTGRKHDRGLDFLAGLLINKAFNSLWRAREDAVCGYGTQSLTLCRAALEDWAALCWVELHPKDVDCWLWPILEEVNQPLRRPPSFERILGELGGMDQALREAYDTLSKFAHPRGTGLAWLIHFEPQNTYFHAGGYFDEHGLRACVYFLVATAQGFLERVARLQSRMLGEVDEPWLAECKTLSKRAEDFLWRVGDEVKIEVKK